MLSHIATDLQQVYLEEVFTPQLGKPGASTPAKPKSSSDLDGDGDVDSFEKKVRQLIYDVRHIMKEKKVPAEKAFQMRSSKTNYGAEIIKTAKEKLGIRGGSSTSVSEEILSEDDKVGIVVNYKNGTTYRKSVSRDSVQTELQKFRSNPNVSSVEQTRYGLRKRDPDGDGKIESPSKEHAGVVHNAIQRATGGTPDGKDTRGKKKTSSKKKLKSYGVSEGFSNWREDLKEVVSSVSDEITSRNAKQIKENPKLDNHKDKIVVINPMFNEKNDILGGTILEAFELDEEYISESVNIATEFFYNCGLNENGVDIVIEELGEEKFAEFVFDLAEEYLLSEARTLTGRKKSPATGKQLGTSRKAAPGKRTKAAVEKHGTTRTLSSSSPSGTIKKRDIGKKIRGDEVNKAIKTAEKEQAPSSEKSRPAGQERIRKTVNDTISRVTSPETRKSVAKTAGNLARGAADTLSRVALSGLEGHKKAMETKKKGGSVAQQLGSGARKALGSFFTKGTKQFREWVEYLISEGYDLSDWTAEELYEEYGYLCEEAEIEQQQKLFGLALSVKRGETPRSEASAEVLKIVDTMSEKKIRDFAKTPHSEVPKKKVNEAIANPTPGKKSPLTTQKQRDAVDKYVENRQNQYGAIGEDMAPTTSKQISANNLVLKAQKLRVSADQQAVQQQKKKSQNSSDTDDKTSTSTKMSLENFVSFSSKTGKREILPGNPPGPNIEKKPGDYDYTRTREQEAAMKKQPKTKIGSRFD